VAAAPSCAAARELGEVSAAGGHCLYSSAGRRSARATIPPKAPSAPRDNGDTIRAGARARSTECRTGSTPGSPDQPRACRCWRAERGPEGQDRPRSGYSQGTGQQLHSKEELSTVSTGLSTPAFGVYGPSTTPFWLIRDVAVDNCPAICAAIDRPAPHPSETGGVASSACRHPRCRLGVPQDCAPLPVAFFKTVARGYDRGHEKFLVTHLTSARFRAGERRLMTTHSFGPGSQAPSNSYSGSPAWNHSHSVAALRAGLIALVLLAVLAVIVLF
jgi:hypothetical protein